MKWLQKFSKRAFALTCLMLAFQSLSSAQQAAVVSINYSQGQFQPSELKAPADKLLTIRVKTLDGKAMEFESTSLRVEKSVTASIEGPMDCLFHTSVYTRQLFVKPG